VITEVDLVRNENFNSGKAYFNNVKLTLATKESDATNLFNTDKSVNAIFGASQSAGAKLDYSSSRQVGLILNLRNNILKDQPTRQKLLTGGHFDTPITLSIATIDAPAQRAKADELKKRFEAQNVKININYYDSVDFASHLTKKDYQLLLYGFDFGWDRDPYTFWHSSQLNALNLAGFSDKASDILMEDARMLPDIASRNAKYDQVFTTLKNNYVVEFYTPIAYNFSVKPEVKGIVPITGTQVYSRFDTIEKWYTDETRVKK
jgi:hypothetical protein